MPFCGEASTWAKVSMILSIFAFGLHCGGYGTNYWMARYTVRDKLNFGVGLWKMTNCSGYYNAPCVDGDIPDEYMELYVTVVRTMESCTLGLIFVCMVCLIFYVGSRRSRTRGMAIAVMVMLFLAATCSIASMIVWTLNTPAHHYANWSFGLTVFACCLAITAGILLIPDVREYDYKDVLRVGGEFQNLAVTQEDSHPPPKTEDMYQVDIKPIVEPQHPRAAPLYNFIKYDKRKGRDGF